MLHIGVMLVFLIIVLNSKHLHIFVAPLNVMFGRRPVALGAAKPLMSDGKVLNLEDADDFDEDTKLGVGSIEDFSWKGMLDFATCTECGRCQSQCPAWNTEKPLSPKLMIMALRDAAFAKAPYSLADEDKRGALLEKDPALAKEAERPLVGPTGDDWFYMPEDGSGVIDPDVLWSCVTCGACVEQCPVDIEHVDHIVDMRRYQVLIESNFPAELNGLFKQMENKGNPWGMSAKARMDWAKDLALRRQGRRRGRREPRRGRLAVLGRLRRRLRGPREEDHRRGRRAALHGRRRLRRPRQRRDLHRRLGPPRRQRVPLPAARHGERRDADRGQGEEGRLDLRPLLQHVEERVRAVRRRSSTSSTTPSC